MFTCVLIAAVIAVVVTLFIAARWVLHPVPQDNALVVTSALRGRSVHTRGRVLVLPMVETASYLSLGPVDVVVERRGRNGLVFADQEHVDVTARLTVRLEPEAETLLRMSRLLGGQRATDPEALGGIFGPALSDALKQTAASMGADCLYQRELFCSRALEALAEDISGYTLEGLEAEFPGLVRVAQRGGPFR